MAGPARARIRPSTLARELDHLLADVAGSVDEVVDRGAPSPERLHDLHRGMRRLRHALAIWEAVLPDRTRELLRPLDRRLKRLARLIGRVRDRDVVLGLLEGPTLPKPPRPETGRVARLRARLRDDGRTGRELLRVYLQSERDAHLFEGLREGLELPPRRGSATDLAAVFDRAESRRHDKVRTAHRRARRHPSSTRLHRLRIQVRRLRHLSEVRTRLDGSPLDRFPPAVRRLQSGLGRLHDLDVVLGELGPDLRATEWVAALRAERRKVRDSLRATIRRHRWEDRPVTGRATSGSRPPARAGS